MNSVGYGVFQRLLKGFLLTIVMTGALRAETTHILALGDSLTAGYGLEQGDGFVPQLEAALQDADLDVAIINAGVSGDTSAGGASRLGWVLSDEVDAVIVALGGNDLLRGLPPEETFKNLDKILTDIGARNLDVLLVGIPGPNNFGADYKSAFEGNFDQLAEKHAVTLYPNFLAGIQAAGDMATVQAVYLQPDGLHPNAAGVQKIIADIQPWVADLIPE